jgi:hypothetical protein
MNNKGLPEDMNLEIYGFIWNQILEYKNVTLKYSISYCHKHLAPSYPLQNSFPSLEEEEQIRNYINVHIKPN